MVWKQEVLPKLTLHLVPTGNELQASSLLASVHGARGAMQSAGKEPSTTVLLSFGPCVLHNQPTRQDAPTGETVAGVLWE